ncbi:hypothetical protein BDFB_002587 [Asbolus verrucosus]|uniref:Uncharacterized protein n=1 Tax=Asbolus verrucosus TaxID=1661398 RepID=A0A482WDI4_ASBVE|nr:hypothetical protein BDFB_002587 [Asbolus verrucosus]
MLIKLFLNLQRYTHAVQQLHIRTTHHFILFSAYDGPISISYDVTSSEPSLVQTPPSAIAAACICSAVRGLKLTSANVATRDVCSMISLDIETLEVLVGIVDGAVEKVVPKTPEKKVKSVEGYESPQYSQPETPTEVENIYF